MKKFWAVIRISFIQEFAYRFNFVLWRFRNIIQILIFLFLWDAVFFGRTLPIFGYSRDQIFTYAFVLIIVRSIVFSVRSSDVAGQIAKGELANALVKPINYYKYWITRDLIYKIINIFFGIFETVFLLFIFKPNIYIQTNFIYIFCFIASIVIAMFMYFTLLKMASMVPFWIPELAWGAQFLMAVIVSEFLSCAAFPLDIFPKFLYELLMLTPFPYLIFVPIKIYLGHFGYFLLYKSLVIGIFWSIFLWKISEVIWNKGLKNYDGGSR